MTKKKWEKTIKENMEAVGIYKISFDPVVKTLAEILEKRDAAMDSFKRSGQDMIVVYNNGSQALNAWIKAWNDLNAQALKYWNELGLTPAGLKKLDEKAMKQTKQSALAKAMSELG